MFTFIDPSFWFFFVYFLIAIFFAFYIPGSFLLQRLHITLFQKTVLSIIVGMVLWGWQGMIFGYLGLRYLSFGYLLLFFLLWIKQIAKKQKGHNAPLRELHFTNMERVIILLILIGTFMQVLTVWFTGALSKSELYFCCGNASDALFYAALTKEIIDHFPPYQPGMNGEIVHNYHYWSNLVLAELIRVFQLPLLATQFQYAMVFISLFFGLTILVFGQLVKVNKIFIAWLLFFLYFGGDLVYLILHFYGTGLTFTVSSIEDGARFLVNPPRAFSIVIFFAGLSFFVLWIKKKELVPGIIMALLFGSVIGFKVYTGLFALVGLASLGAYYLLKRNFKMLIPIILTPLIGCIVYLPVNQGSGGLYFTGLWLFENFRTHKEFRLEGWEYAKLLYYQHHNWPRIIQYELMFAGLYIISMFGSKLLGLFQTRKSLSMLPRELHIFLVPAIVVSAIIGFFFQQTSGGTNTFNFLVSVFLIGSIYTALTATYLTERVNNIVVFFIVIPVIVLLTIPRVVYETLFSINRLSNKAGVMINNTEFEAYRYINQHTERDAHILFDYSKFVLASDSPYISMFTDRNVFLVGERILVSHGIDISHRKNIQQTILRSRDPKKVNALLLDNKIDYLMISAQTTLPIERIPGFVSTVFKNEKIKILKPLYSYENFVLE